MFNAIPRAALLLGAAGVLPFLLSALMRIFGADIIPNELHSLFGTQSAREIAISYGVVILCFMSGCLWGFATKGGLIDYTLSVIPALYCFFFVTGTPNTQLSHLIYGFAGLLIIDYIMAAKRFAPSWWMRLRIPLTLAVVACLLVVRYG